MNDATSTDRPGWPTSLLLCLAMLAVGSICGCDALSPADDPNDDPPATDPLNDQVGSGTGQIVGKVMSADDADPIPLGGTRLQAGDAVTHANVDGSFALIGVPAGEVSLLVDGGALQARDGSYGQFRVTLDLAEQEARVIDHPIYLPFVPDAARRDVKPAETTTVGSADGLMLEIPPGAARFEGKEYTGTIAVLQVPIEQLPIPVPESLAEQIDFAVVVQPVDLSFPVPLALSIPVEMDEKGIAGRRYRTLWSLSPETGEYRAKGIATAGSSEIATTLGGMAHSGWHLISTLHVAVPTPCGQESTECLASAEALSALAQALDRDAVAGATTVFGRLEAAMAVRGTAVEDGEKVIDIAAELQGRARQAALTYRDVYRQLADVSELDVAVAGAASTCQATTGCGLRSDFKDGWASTIESAIDRVAGNVEDHTFRFERLAAAVAGLDPFFADEPLSQPGMLEAFDAAAAEYQNAYHGFDLYASPIDAYDDLLADVAVIQDAARQLIDVADAGSGDGTIIAQRACVPYGVTSVDTVADGYATLQPGDDSGKLQEACFVAALQTDSDLASVPSYETDWIERGQIPPTLPLDRHVQREPLSVTDLHAGVLTSETPIHMWTLDIPLRRGAQIAYDATGDAIVALTTDTGVMQLAWRGGFDVINMTNRSSLALQTWRLESGDEVEVPYTLSATTTDTLHDFGSAIVGSFDVHTRAAVVLLEGSASERILLQRSCCDVGSAGFDQRLVGPEGQRVPVVGVGDEDENGQSELYELPADGMYRVVLHAMEGQFADWEVSVHRVPTNDPIRIELDQAVTAEFDDPGEVAVFTFDIATAQAGTITGIASLGVDPVAISLLSPDGTILADDEPLFFDGSSFSTRVLSFPEPGTYELSVHTPTDAATKLGTATFRIEAIPIS